MWEVNNWVGSRRLFRLATSHTILRVQIDTIFAWVLSFLQLQQPLWNQYFSEWQMHPYMGGYRYFLHPKNYCILLFKLIIVIQIILNFYFVAYILRITD